MNLKQDVDSHSARIFNRAKAVFPGGITRATIPCDPLPTYIERGEGAYLVDVDGRRFLDLNNNFTTLIHGHAFAPVIDAVCDMAQRGTCYAGPTEAEVILAEMITGRVQGMDKIRFVNTGSEAVMFAIKAARAYTGKSAIAKVEGAYHGSYDWAEVSSAPGSQVDIPVPVPKYRGAPAGVTDDVVLLRLNDLEGTERALNNAKERVGAILIDPMPSRAGLITPDPEYIALLHDLAHRHGFLIISDEVLNFRRSLSGAATKVGLKPDLWTLGKIIGGGLPIGAIAGREEVMAVFSTKGFDGVAQGGTFSANPLSMTAGAVCLAHLDAETMARLNTMGDTLRSRLQALCYESGEAFTVTGAGSLFCIHPKAKPPREAREATLTAEEAEIARRMTRFFENRGVVLPFNAAACLSTVMGEAELDTVTDVFADFLRNNKWKTA